MAKIEKGTMGATRKRNGGLGNKIIIIHILFFFFPTFQLGSVNNPVNPNNFNLPACLLHKQYMCDPESAAVAQWL